MWSFKKKHVQNRPGLEVKFSIGELIPLKGIWFRIDKVHFDRLELIPMNVTGQMQKRIKEARNG